MPRTASVRQLALLLSCVVDGGTRTPSSRPPCPFPLHAIPPLVQVSKLATDLEQLEDDNLQLSAKCEELRTENTGGAQKIEAAYQSLLCTAAE